jgi:hypothetical protein
MPSLISPQLFEKYRGLIQETQFDTFYQDQVVWRRFEGLDRWKEDNLPLQPVDYSLKGLYSYNYFRQWQITVDTLTGTLDKVTEAVIFSRKYLEDEGLVRPDGAIAFDAGSDEFYVRGRWYKMVGDTDIAQSFDKPLLYMIVLQRQESKTGAPSPFLLDNPKQKINNSDSIALVDSSIKAQITHKIELNSELQIL